MSFHYEKSQRKTLSLSNLMPPVNCQVGDNSKILTQWDFINQGAVLQQISKLSKYKNLTLLGNIVTDSRKCDTGIWRRIRTVKEPFQKQSKVLNKRKISLDRRKQVFNCYVIWILLHSNGCRKLERGNLWWAETGFYKRTLRRLWTEHESNDVVLHGNKKDSYI